MNQGNIHERTSTTAPEASVKFISVFGKKKAASKAGKPQRVVSSPSRVSAAPEAVAAPPVSPSLPESKSSNAPSNASPASERPVLRHADDAVATILMRDAYTRERHFFLLRLILALSAVLVAETWVVSILAMRPPVYKYFATDREGRIQPITPIDQPIGSQTEVSNWVAGAVVRAYTFDFANWRAQLSAARNDFTPQGWKGFEAALKDSGVLQTVLEKKYVTTAVPTGAPVMINQGVVDGHYAWKFQMPILVTYQSSERTVPQNLMVNVLVVRQSEMENPRGLGIAQLIAQ